MKKALFTLLAASLLLTVASCKKDGGVDVVFPDPATKANAVSIEFNKGKLLELELPERAKPTDPTPANPGTNVDLEIHGIDLTEGNRYILYVGDKKEVKGLELKKMKFIWIGHYSIVGQAFKLDGIGEIKVADNKSKIDFTPASTVDVKGDTPSYSYEATVTPIATTSTVAANLARNWKVKNTFVQIEGGKADQKVTVKKSFVGCDLHEIARTLKENKVSLSDADVAQLAGYNLTELNFIGNSNLIMNFDGPESYYGTWNVSGNTVTWEMNDSNKLLSAKATGTISFPGNKAAQLLVNADVAAGDEKYTGTIRFDLEQID